jgi:hypothetical protein
MASDHSLNSRKKIEDDAALKPSYGADVPKPEGFVKGTVDNFGILAGSGNIRPRRSIHLEDSINEQLGNMPGSRKAK